MLILISIMPYPVAQVNSGMMATAHMRQHFVHFTRALSNSALLFLVAFSLSLSLSHECTLSISCSRPPLAVVSPLWLSFPLSGCLQSVMQAGQGKLQGEYQLLETSVPSLQPGEVCCSPSI